MHEATTSQRPQFLRDTAVTADGDGDYTADCSPEWGVPTGGPNGGYLAAIVLRAMMAQVADAAREPRSLTLHYLRAPRSGEVRMHVTVERTGRTLSTLTARLEQDGRPCVLAIGAFGGPFPTAVDFATTPPPTVAPAAEIPPAEDHPALPPVARRLETRRAIGEPPFSGAAVPDSGGWLRLRDPAPVDAPLLALLVDAWLPAVFPILTAPALAPTIDLTIHFRNPRAAALHPADEPLLARFTAATSHDGYVEEDGFVWTPGGVLLAQSRQLALLRPLPPDASAAADGRP